jgi:hypothetical protein
MAVAVRVSAILTQIMPWDSITASLPQGFNFLLDSKVSQDTGINIAHQTWRQVAPLNLLTYFVLGQRCCSTPRFPGAGTGSNDK